MSFQGKRINSSKVLGDLRHRNKLDLRAMSLSKIKEIFHLEAPKCVTINPLMDYRKKYRKISLYFLPCWDR